MGMFVAFILGLAMMGLFIGLPYVEAHKRRKELERRGRFKRPQRDDEDVVL